LLSCAFQATTAAALCSPFPPAFCAAAGSGAASQLVSACALVTLRPPPPPPPAPPPLPPSPAPPPDALVRYLADLPSITSVAGGVTLNVTTSSADPAYGDRWAPLQWPTALALFSAPGRCGNGSVLFSSSGAERYPWYTVDLGALFVITDVQLWFAADGSAWPSGGVSVLVTTVPPALSGAAAIAASIPRCYISPAGTAFQASLQGVCAGMGRYVTAQLSGPTDGYSVTSGGASLFVLRLCAFFVYGYPLPIEPPTQLLSPAPQTDPGLYAGPICAAAFLLLLGLAAHRRWEAGWRAAQARRRAIAAKQAEIAEAVAAAAAAEAAAARAEAAEAAAQGVAGAEVQMRAPTGSPARDWCARAGVARGDALLQFAAAVATPHPAGGAQQAWAAPPARPEAVVQPWW